MSCPDQDFLDIVSQAFAQKEFQRFVLSKYSGDEKGLEKVTCRTVILQNQPKISFLYHYQTQDITKNFDEAEAIKEIKLLLSVCKQANLWTSTQELQLKRTKKKTLVTSATVKQNQTSIQQHNREKQRFVEQSQNFLKDLGITDQSAQIIPSMARKWKQINKFIEIFSNAVQQISKKDDRLHVVDFGSGKGYLTFAMYDYLQQHGLKSVITGVELRDNLVNFCQNVSEKNHFEHLSFFKGDVRSYQPDYLDVMVALHACDIATDFAIHCGIRLNASMIMCAPCCHKELRPQLQSPKELEPMLAYGIHQGQQAEMLTDTIRAMLLNAYGYETKVFEFVALEHTSKNKMILAIKRRDVTEPDAKIMQQIETLKNMYGIKQHSLERLLQDERVDQDRLGCRC